MLSNTSCKAFKCNFLSSAHFLIHKVHMAGLFGSHKRLEGCFCSSGRIGRNFPQWVVGRLDWSGAPAAPMHPAVPAASHTEGTMCSHTRSECGIAWVKKIIPSIFVYIGFHHRKPLPGHVQLSIHQHPQVLLSRAAPSLFIDAGGCPNLGAGPCTWPCWTSWGSHRPTSPDCPHPSGWHPVPQACQLYHTAWCSLQTCQGCAWSHCLCHWWRY